MHRRLGVSYTFPAIRPIGYVYANFNPIFDPLAFKDISVLL